MTPDNARYWLCPVCESIMDSPTDTEWCWGCRNRRDLRPVFLGVIRGGGVLEVYDARHRLPFHTRHRVRRWTRHAG